MLQQWLEHGLMKVSNLGEYDGGWILEKRGKEILNLEQS